MNKKPKNLIIISIDTLRSDCISANPHKELLNKYKLKNQPKTPILDWFAKNGTFFTNCISTAPYTTTSHASILTGQYPYTHKLQHFYKNKLESETIFEIFKKEGFATLSQVDFLFMGPLLGFANGVDKFVEGDDDESFKWIEKNKNKRKVCFFHLAGAHEPYGFAYNCKKNPQGIRDFSRKIKSLSNNHKIKKREESKRIVHKGKSTHDLSKKEMTLWCEYKHIIKELHAQGKYDEIMDLYVEGVNYFENSRLSKLMKKFLKLNIFNDSIVVLLGDHGEAWSRNQMGHYLDGNFTQESLYDGVMKVPLIFFGEGIPRGFMVDYQNSTVDIVPTLVNLFGFDEKKMVFDGKSLAPFEKRKKDRDVYMEEWVSYDVVKNGFGDFLTKARTDKNYFKQEFKKYIKKDGLRDGRIKIVRYFNSDGSVEKIEYLDVKKGENKIVPNREITKKLLSKINKFSKITGEKTSKNNVKSGEMLSLKEAIRTLGY